MQVGELAPPSSTKLFSVHTPFAETIRSTCSGLHGLAGQAQAATLRSPDMFTTASFVSDIRRDQMLFPRNITPINSNVTTFLNQFAEQSQRISTSITQLFERIHTDHLGLRQVGEHLHLLSLEYDNVLALPSFSTDLGQFIQATLPDYKVKPARSPAFEARRRSRLNPPEWPAIPAELQAKSSSEIAQETEIYCLKLLEEDEQSAWEILDEHERRYTGEIELAEWDLIEAQEAGCAETASQIIQVGSIPSSEMRCVAQGGPIC